MTDHPASYRLEELAAGQGDDEIVRHVEDCQVCRQYVDRLVEASRRFGASEQGDADAFADRVVARRSRTRSLSRGARVAIAVPMVVAAAAGVFFWMQPATGPVPAGPTEIAFAPTEPAVRFKGAPQLAVIRERTGQQERLAVDVGVRAHDRLRVELSLDTPTIVEIGVLSDDGSWVTLLPAQMLTAGTHYSPQAVRFDDTPTGGWVVAGAPAAVQRARDSRDFHEVAVIPLRVERTP